MKIFIYIDDADLEDEIAPQVNETIAHWVTDCDCTAEAINQQGERTGDRVLGMTIKTSKKAMLKKALDFLYGLAEEFEQDFVVGIIDADTGAEQKVCYFGHEEGRPDINEIGSYLGLRH